MSRDMTRSSLIRVFAVRLMGTKDPSFLHANSEDSDQTGWMSRLIWVFAGRTVTLLVLSCRDSIIIFKLLLNVPCFMVLVWNFEWLSSVCLIYILSQCCFYNSAAVRHNQQNDMCSQRRLRSAWASAQSDQSLRYSAWRNLGSLASHWEHSED